MWTYSNIQPETGVRFGNKLCYLKVGAEFVSFEAHSGKIHELFLVRFVKYIAILQE
jgi:hypothetical protein